MVMEFEEEDVDSEVVELKGSLDAKLRELLHNVISTEIKLCSAAAKEFIKLLKSKVGGELLRLYVQTSSSFMELVGSWKVQQGKPGIRYIFLLISAILSHPDGKYVVNDNERIGISRVIDKFARSIIEEKLEVIYEELGSKEVKNQNAALMLLSSIVKRGSGLASEVAKSFNFKLPAFLKLVQYKKRRNDEKKRRSSTRKEIVRFAMSFLEEGKPGLLRWVLQQKEMYSGVLRMLGDDDDETVVYVLSTLRDRVHSEHSLVPPHLRSVLFGSATLEQLISISARENGGPVEELAHNLLIMVCTDPCNGLMPDLQRHPNPLRGNTKRLLDLMKKLRATEIGYHRDLLLAIVQGRPSFGSAYMEEFPYNLEDFGSPAWFPSVCLAANIVSSIGVGQPFAFLNCKSGDPPSFNSTDVQNIVNCIAPRVFNRSVINKGLLNSDFIIKNGTLRLLLETLNLLDSFFKAIDFSSSKQPQSWASLKKEVQNTIQSAFPDPQVLLNLLSSMNSCIRRGESSLKRKSLDGNFLQNCSNRKKKLKTNDKKDDADIILGGISSSLDFDLPVDSENIKDAEMPDGLENLKDFVNVLSELWGSSLCSKDITSSKDGEMLFYSKLFDALKIYLLTIPTALDGSFDFFMNLLSNHAALPTNLLSSVLALLLEYIKWSPRSGVAVKTPPLMYKRLQPFINLLIFSPVNGIRVQAYNLARACMLSSGAFDRNLHEIDAWFMYLPGYSAVESAVGVQGIEVLKRLSFPVISFLCDAISTVGNNLFRYWDILRNDVSHVEEFKDVSPEFSPLIICVLQKCERLLNSESGTYSIPEKSMISLYVCYTLKYLLQTQVDAGLLSALISSFLSKVLQQRWSLDDDSVDSFCEWRPLKNLLLFAQSVCQKDFCFSSKDQKAATAAGSFTRTLDEVQKIMSGNGGEMSGIMNAFSSALICTSCDEVLSNFPLVMSISQYLQVPLSLLELVLNCKQSFLAGIMKLWPKVFFSSLETAAYSQAMTDDAFSLDRIGMPTFDSNESVAATTFSHFLREAAFHILFPAVMSTDILCLSESSTVSGLLLAKLSECSSYHLVSNHRLLLFWFSQIQSSYRHTPSIELEKMAELCHNMMKQILNQLLALKCDSGILIQDVARTIFFHPVVAAFLASPMSCNNDFTGEEIGGSLEDFIKFSSEGLHKIDHYILDLLTNTVSCLSSPSSGLHFILSAQDDSLVHLVKPFKTLIKKLYVQLEDKSDLCIKTGAILPILPYFCSLHVLKQFVSPFEVLELVCSLFGKTNVKSITGEESRQTSVLYVGFCLAADAFENLSVCFQHPMIENGLLHTFQEKERNYGIRLVEEIFNELCRFAIEYEMDAAYTCLLKVVSSVFKQSCMQKENVHPLSIVLSRIIMNSPIEIVSHCINRTNKTKATLLSVLVEMSSLHLSVFGYILSGTLKLDSHPRGKLMVDICSFVPSEEDFIMLLPALFLYMKSNVRKLDINFAEVAAFYSKILVTNFQSWNSFTTASLFQEKFGECLPSSVEGLLNLVDGSLLGKAVQMLKWYFSFGGDMETEDQLKLFDSVFPCSAGQDELLDSDLLEFVLNSPNQSLNFINRVVAKIQLALLLLWKDKAAGTDGNHNDISCEMFDSKEAQSKMQFINILVDAWKCMVKKLPFVSDYPIKEKNSNCLQVFRYLELFILGKILELTVKMKDALIQLQSIPFLDKLMRLFLLNRFEDPATLRIVRNILIALTEGNFSYALYLQLLLAHSQFALTIRGVTESFSSQIGPLFRPLSSILRSVDTPHPESKQDQKKTELYLKKLEVVKLLRVLFQLRPHLTGSHDGKDFGINLKELHLLLLSSYGATLSKIDLEIYAIMQELESMDRSIFYDFAKMDYLWGSAGLFVRTERAMGQNLTPNLMTDAEAVEEFRRSQFRENLPVDPKLCVNTVLHFPYDRTADSGSLSLKGIELDNLKHRHELHATEIESANRYDPVFILRFALHALSMGHLEPMEFASLGLLAVSFVSMSSPDVAMRKLGYEFLGRYKKTIEKSQKRTDRMRIRLLLTYLQNGIEEPWQRIPSIIALFAAESSFILLDPLHDNYAAISKHLMHSSMVNMKSIPLFQNLFQNNSTNSRADQLWTLRLAYVGLSLNDDAQIFIRNSIVETLLSFYASPLSNNEAKKLILQIVKKSVKLHTIASYLVEHCGLFPWLSSVLSTFSGVTNEHEKSFLSQQLIMVAEVVADVVSIRKIAEWLQNYALEQLIDLASHFYKLLIDGSKLIKENAALVNSMLQTVTQALEISQKRKLCQPHFTLSFEGIFQIYCSLHECITATSSANEEIGLKTILMNTPAVDIFDLDPERLSSFLMWAVSTALKSDFECNYLRKESNVTRMIMSEEVTSEDCLILKLLRWLVASVILGKLPQKLDVKTKSSDELSYMSLKCFLECCGESYKSRYNSEENLAATIIFLQQLYGVDFTLLPSVASALGLLVFSDAPSYSDANSDYMNAAASLCIRIRPPTEANPAWRWSYYRPWKDLSSEPNELQRMEEFHACQTLLVMVSNVLAKKPLESQLLSYQDVDKCGVFGWQRTLVETEPQMGKF